MAFEDELELLPLHLQDWYARGQRHLVDPMNNISMFAIVEGEGPETVVLTHGLPCSSYDYNRALSMLVDKGYRVVTFDLPGYGFSDKPHQVRESLFF